LKSGFIVKRVSGFATMTYAGQISAVPKNELPF
jgi:hypothetical protein